MHTRLKTMASLLVAEADDVGVDSVNEDLQDLLFFYDNFESIGDILNTDTSIQEQFMSAESQVSAYMYRIVLKRNIHRFVRPFVRSTLLYMDI